MEIDVLVRNIEKARDQALADHRAFIAERDQLAGSADSLGETLRLTISAIAADTVAANLSRILGEERSRPTQEAQVTSGQA
ncbi:hypothetical protein GB931_11210 [Modestobacter sp. I12A-02628]|uniref:Uncharacterized protein n=1 Tax=Goekera deserti TaxID=2497753 RepID=A0A7K3WC66_9ACTN|nr:hypothetical protein [Goekera deserti]MPQ98474.1 hypothetical protein [Goekera deserti]NDI48303.1 hypothetical protein [Goekera deserti]NEL54052.1 hypothetical protein [Goekera deserti]